MVLAHSNAVGPMHAFPHARTPTHATLTCARSHTHAILQGKRKGGTESASEEEMEVDSDVDADGENDASTAKELRNKTAASTYDVCAV